VQFLRRLNELVHDRVPGAITLAEESTAWPIGLAPDGAGRARLLLQVEHGVDARHAGVHGRMTPCTAAITHELTFGLIYAFSENFVLPLSHDEVVHGRARWSTRCRATRGRSAPTCAPTTPSCSPTRARSCCSWATRSPNGSSGTTTRASTGTCSRIRAQGIQLLVKDLNRLYRTTPALSEGDHHPEGFLWIESNDYQNSVVSFVRRARNPDDFVVVVCNFTPIARPDYRIGVPATPGYREVLNSDSQSLRRSDVGNHGYVQTERIAAHASRPRSASSCRARGLVLHPAPGP